MSLQVMGYELWVRGYELGVRGLLELDFSMRIQKLNKACCISFEM